jgi:hypothetical protein
MTTLRFNLGCICELQNVGEITRGISTIPRVSRLLRGVLLRERQSIALVSEHT